MIKWLPWEKTIVLSWVTPKETRKTLIKFGGGTEETNQACVTEFEVFLRRGSKGFDRSDQFECVAEWHWKLWEVAINDRVWGLPVKPEESRRSRRRPPPPRTTTDLATRMSNTRDAKKMYQNMQSALITLKRQGQTRRLRKIPNNISRPPPMKTRVVSKYLSTNNNPGSRNRVLQSFSERVKCML